MSFGESVVEGVRSLDDFGPRPPAILWMGAGERFGFQSDDESDRIGCQAHLRHPSMEADMAYRGYPFEVVDDRLKRQVWEKGRVVSPHDGNTYRQDICGNWMKFDLHGQEVEYGWEIDHIVPRARGGKTEIANLQPLWWRNNRSKSDKYPWKCGE